MKRAWGLLAIIVAAGCASREPAPSEASLAGTETVEAPAGVGIMETELGKRSDEVIGSKR